MHGVTYVNFPGHLERNRSHLAVAGEKQLATLSVAAWCYWFGAIIYGFYRAVRECALVSFRALLPADNLKSTWIE